MRIATIGSGYVGLVSGACLAHLGHEVVCVDKDFARIESLRKGASPIFEPGLDGLMLDGMAAGRLSFTTDLPSAVAKADIVLIAVGTPMGEDGSADLSHVHAAASQIAAALSGFTVIVTKSTVPVGTGDAIEAIVRRTNPAADVAVVSNPEFLREGSAIGDFLRPDRIVVGMDDERARPALDALYLPLSDRTILHVGRRTAELTKYAANAFLAMKVAFINEMADLCEGVGADVEEIASGIGLDRRIGSKFLQAGPGYGGSCFPKDTAALAYMGRANDSPMQLVETTVRLNQARSTGMLRKIGTAMGGSLFGRRIAVLGLAFKAGTDDMRDSPAIGIVRALVDAGAKVAVHDPVAMENAERILGDGVIYRSSPHEAVAGADCIVLATEWQEYRQLDLGRLGASMRSRTLIDLRNMFDGETAARNGFAYTSIGRPDQDVVHNPSPVARAA